VITPLSVSANEFARRSKASHRSVLSEYDALRIGSQREAIDRVVEDVSREEAHPLVEWKLCYIKATRKEIPGTSSPYTATETVSIYIILKRQPRASSPQALNASSWTAPSMIGFQV
jgi:hypothetical protein